MDILQAGSSSSCCCGIQLLRQPPLLPRFSSSSALNNNNNNNLFLLRSRSRTPLTLTPNFFHNSTRKPLTTKTTTTRSLLEDDSAASVKVIKEVDPFLAAKKKATEISPALKGTSIFLVGISSTIKTRLGKLLADAFRYYFFDSDSLIEEAARSESSAKSFRERDEKGFRESETEVLKQLSAMGRLVVSVGDGAVQTSTNLSLLRHGISVWIDVPLDLVAREISEDGIQLPASQKSTSGSYSEVYTRVTQLYAEVKGGYAVADATVSLQKVASLLGYDECDAVPMEDLCLEVLKEIEKLMRVKKLMEEAARPF